MTHVQHRISKLLAGALAVATISAIPASAALAADTPGTGTCTLSAGQTPTLVQPGATGLSGTLNAGAYCVQISDATVQLGPVAYTIVIVAP